MIGRIGKWKVRINGKLDGQKSFQFVLGDYRKLATTGFAIN